MAKKIEKVKVEVEESIPEPIIPEIKVKSEKEKLLELYQTLKDLGISRISDLENLIAKAE